MEKKMQVKLKDLFNEGFELDIFYKEKFDTFIERIYKLHYLNDKNLNLLNFLIYYLETLLYLHKIIPYFNKIKNNINNFETNVKNAPNDIFVYDYLETKKFSLINHKN